MTSSDRLAICVTCLLAVATASACGSDDPAPSTGEVVIETTTDASNAPEIVGTMEVTEGADILGCEAATFTRTAIEEGDEGVVDTFTATCEDGTRDGTFDVVVATIDESSATWEMAGATGGFDGLSGEGEASLSTWTGSVAYPESADAE